MTGGQIASVIFLVVVIAFGAYLDVPRILNTPAGIVHGAANVDVAVRIPLATRRVRSNRQISGFFHGA